MTRLTSLLLILFFVSCQKEAALPKVDTCTMITQSKPVKISDLVTTNEAAADATTTRESFHSFTRDYKGVIQDCAGQNIFLYGTMNWTYRMTYDENYVVLTQGGHTNINATGKTSDGEDIRCVAVSNSNIREDGGFIRISARYQTAHHAGVITFTVKNELIDGIWVVTIYKVEHQCEQ